MKGKLAASLIVVFVMLVLLLLLNAGKTEVSKVYLPSELIELAKETDAELIPRVRLAARVAEGDIKYQVEPEIKLEFLAKNPPNKDGTPTQSTITLPIVYNGIKPDMFAVDRDVIVDGELRQGTFYASKLLTQCPSKYEAPKPEQS
jgi:cytochrome c-type biogenesis protein CcmE